LISSQVGAGIGRKKLSSKIRRIGIARKVFIFVTVAIAHQIDSALSDQHMLLGATIFFYLSNELLPIIENVAYKAVDTVRH